MCGCSTRSLNLYKLHSHLFSHKRYIIYSLIISVYNQMVGGGGLFLFIFIFLHGKYSSRAYEHIRKRLTHVQCFPLRLPLNRKYTWICLYIFVIIRVHRLTAQHKPAHYTNTVLYLTTIQTFHTECSQYVYHVPCLMCPFCAVHFVCCSKRRVCQSFHHQTENISLFLSILFFTFFFR